MNCSRGTPQYIGEHVDKGVASMTGETRGAIEILLVEDNAGDVRLTKEALAESKIITNLHVVNDGVAALEFLKMEGPYKGSPQPDLILLDLNLPKKSGFEVLVGIKQDQLLRTIPVIILTSSDAEGDARKCYENYVNAYITKPVNIEDYFILVRRIDEFWLRSARFLTPSTIKHC